MAKIIGYVVSLIGVVFLLASIKPINSLIAGYIPGMENIATYYFAGVGIVVLLVGIILLRRFSGGKQAKEVPIYQGKNVVGYRRMGK